MFATDLRDSLRFESSNLSDDPESTSLGDLGRRIVRQTQKIWTTWSATLPKPSARDVAACLLTGREQRELALEQSARRKPNPGAGH